MVDFYHVSEYLANVAKDLFKEVVGKIWLKTQQTHLKEGNLYLVLQELERYVYEDKPIASVKNCYRYLTNRLDQLDYLGALTEDLPIGSGEIESGHRHVGSKTDEKVRKLVERRKCRKDVAGYRRCEQMDYGRIIGKIKRKRLLKKLLKN